jgi:hypothetical protein
MSETRIATARQVGTLQDLCRSPVIFKLVPPSITTHQKTASAAMVTRRLRDGE